jgi:hypothetical protein
LGKINKKFFEIWQICAHFFMKSFCIDWNHIFQVCWNFVSESSFRLSVLSSALPPLSSPNMLLATEGFGYLIYSCSSCNLSSLMISSCNPPSLVVSSFSLDLDPSLLYLSFPLVGCFVLLTLLGRFSPPLKISYHPRWESLKTLFQMC